MSAALLAVATVAGSLAAISDYLARDFFSAAGYTIMVAACATAAMRLWTLQR